MFVNYFADDRRTTPINLAAVRVLLGAYVFWRVVSLDVRALLEWPLFIYPSYGVLYPPAGFEWVLLAEKWALLAAAVAFLVGYRTRWSAFTVGALLGHLTTVLMTQNHTGETQEIAIACLFVVLFGLYAERDALSIDGFRATRDASLDALNDRLREPTDETYRMEPLKWSLVTVSILYVGGPWIRATNAGLLAWAAPESLARWTTYFQSVLYVQPALADILLAHPLLLQAATWGTLFLESALIAVVLLKRPVFPVIVLLIGMHLTIFATMRILFFDMVFFLLLFAEFDRVYARLVSDREIDLVYDEHCFFCVRALSLFKLLDVNGTVTFRSQHDVPEAYREEFDVDFEDAMYVFTADGSECHRGYWAFRELFRQFWVTVPATWLMALAPVATAGERVYGYVAANRDRHFVCSVESTGDP